MIIMLKNLSATMFMAGLPFMFISARLGYTDIMNKIIDAMLIAVLILVFVPNI